MRQRCEQREVGQRCDLIIGTPLYIVFGWLSDHIGRLKRVGRVDDPSLVTRKIGEIARGLFASPEYLARRGTPHKPEHLEEVGQHRRQLVQCKGRYTIDAEPSPWPLTCSRHFCFRIFDGGKNVARTENQTVAGRRWRWKWQAQDAEDVDEDAPFYADAVSGFRGAYAINHPVQGSSAEVMQIAVTRLEQALHDLPAQLIATVHDEAVLLVPDDVAAVERIGAIAQQEMVAAFLEVFADAPLNLVDPKLGPTWAHIVLRRAYFL